MLRATIPCVVISRRLQRVVCESEYLQGCAFVMTARAGWRPSLTSVHITCELSLGPVCDVEGCDACRHSRRVLCRFTRRDPRRTVIFYNLVSLGCESFHT